MYYNEKNFIQSGFYAFNFNLCPYWMQPKRTFQFSEQQFDSKFKPVQQHEQFQRKPFQLCKYFRQYQQPRKQYNGTFHQ